MQFITLHHYYYYFICCLSLTLEATENRHIHCQQNCWKYFMKTDEILWGSLFFFQHQSMMLSQQVCGRTTLMASVWGKISRKANFDACRQQIGSTGSYICTFDKTHSNKTYIPFLTGNNCVRYKDACVHMPVHVRACAHTHIHLNEKPKKERQAG